MEEHACCAICGNPLTAGRDVTPINIGSTAPSALRRRRRIVAQKREARAAREHVDPGPKDEGEMESSENEEGWLAEYEDRSYDPELVSEDSLKWLSASLCLGASCCYQTRDRRAFLSGNVISYNTGWAQAERGSDPGEPTDRPALACYTVGHADGIVVFPFHSCCLAILTEALTGSRDFAKIDKDVLYDALSEVPLRGRYGLSLDLDYGLPSEQSETGWSPVPGEEFSVTNPFSAPTVTEWFKECLAMKFDLRADSLDNLRNPTVQDPFSYLPAEILVDIFRLLPSNDMRALLSASWPALNATRRNGFWKWFLKHDMPWLWELWPLVDETEQLRGLQPCYKSLYVWLKKATAPECAMQGPAMSLANRRRIWGVCERLAGNYFRHLYVTSSMLAPDTSIAESAACHHMAFISNNHTVPDNSWAIRKTLFMYSRDEIFHKPVILEACWGESGGLVGLCAIVGQQRRVFGLNGAGMPHITRTAVRIPGNQMITAMVLGVETSDPNRGGGASPRVLSVEVRTNDNWWFYLRSRKKDCDDIPHTNAAVLTIPQGAFLVGITGQIGHDGTIQSIGLLETSLPPPRAISGLHSTQDISSRNSRYMNRFWTGRTARLLMHCGATSPASVDHVFPLTVAPSTVSLVPDHLIPHETFVWAEDEWMLAKLKRLVMYVSPKADTGRAVVLHGLSAGFTWIKGLPEPYAGLRSNVGSVHGPPAWPEDQVVSFKIDGPGGERIDEVAASQSLDDAIAFKIKTNRGREISVGNPGSQGWTSQRAPDGESIVGLIVGFTGKTNVPRYGGLSSLLVMTERLPSCGM